LRTDRRHLGGGADTRHLLAPAGLSE
jgi:hypothetical protein